MTDAFVWFQHVEHSDDVATVHSFPAVVTARTMRPAPILDDTGKQIKDDRGLPVWGEPVEVLSLTIFVKGDFEFYDEVWPYTDELGLKGGSNSWREIQAEAPEIDLKAARERKAQAKAEARGTEADSPIRPMPTSSGDGLGRRITPE